MIAYFLGNNIAKIVAIFFGTVYVKIIASQRWDVFLGTVYILLVKFSQVSLIVTGVQTPAFPDLLCLRSNTRIKVRGGGSILLPLGFVLTALCSHMLLTSVT